MSEQQAHAARKAASPGGRRRLLLTGLPLLGASAAAALVAWRADPDGAQARALQSDAGRRPNALAVTTAPAVLMPLARTVSLDAELKSLSSPAISAQVGGTVTEVNVLPGQAVTKGQVLAVIDDADLALALAEAQAQAGQVRAQLAERERQLARDEALAKQEYVSRSTLLASRADVAATRSQLAAAQARVALAERAQAKAYVRAPHDGTLVQQHVAPGTYVRAGDVLFALWSPQSVVLTARASQALAGEVKSGQPVRLVLGQRVLATQVERVSPSIDPVSRSFDVHLEVPAELAGYAGATFAAELSLDNTPALTVPAAAVQLNGTAQTVFVVENARAVAREVTLGRQQAGRVEVLGGLAEGDAVLVQGAAFARDGMAVQVVSSQPEAPAP